MINTLKLEPSSLVNNDLEAILTQSTRESSTRGGWTGSTCLAFPWGKGQASLKVTETHTSLMGVHLEGELATRAAVLLKEVSGLASLTRPRMGGNWDGLPYGLEGEHAPRPVTLTPGQRAELVQLRNKLQAYAANRVAVALFRQALDLKANAWDHRTWDRVRCSWTALEVSCREYLERPV